MFVNRDLFSSLTYLTPEMAVTRFRDLLFCEARYAKLSPSAITISSELYASDGGIDAHVEANHLLPSDSLLKPGENGFQLKTGTAFKPWQPSILKKELLTQAGELASEVRRILEAGGRYVLVCFGIDLTPEQRQKSHRQLVSLLADAGLTGLPERIDVYGQTQLAGFFARYPALLIALAGGDTDDDFLTVAAWARHAHMSATWPSGWRKPILLLPGHAFRRWCSACEKVGSYRVRAPSLSSPGGCIFTSGESIGDGMGGDSILLLFSAKCRRPCMVGSCDCFSLLMILRLPGSFHGHVVA